MGKVILLIAFQRPDAFDDIVYITVKLNIEAVKIRTVDSVINYIMVNKYVIIICD